MWPSSCFFLLRASYPRCTSVGRSKRSRSTELSMQWESPQSSPVRANSTTASCNTEPKEKHGHVCSFPQPFPSLKGCFVMAQLLLPSWPLRHLCSCGASQHNTNASCRISPFSSQLSTCFFLQQQLLLLQAADFQNKYQKKKSWDFCAENESKAKPRRHPDFLKGFLNSHCTFLTQNVNTDDHLCHSGMCDNSSAISISPGRRAGDGFACNCCTVVSAHHSLQTARRKLNGRYLGLL